MINIFDLFKKRRKKEDQTLKDAYSILSTNDETIIDPTWEQVKMAIGNAQPNRSVFASFSYVHAEFEIEVIQVISENDVYRFEALPSKRSKDYKSLFINETLSYEEALNLFKTFYKHGIVKGYKEWYKERNKF